MLDFIFLLEILLIFAAVYGIIILAKFIKGRTDIHVKYGSTDILSELGDLRKDNSEGATGYEVRLTADSTKTIGKVVVKDEVGWVYLPKTDEAYSNDKKGFRKVGYVDKDGYIYISRKGQEAERIGYLAQPSKPNVPTIIGERNWRDLKWSSHLNVYYGDPEGWGAEEIETVEPIDDVSGENIPDHNSAEKPVSQEVLESSGNEPFTSQSFAAVPPARKRSEVLTEGQTEQVTEEQVVETPEVTIADVQVPEVEIPEAETPVIEEPEVEIPQAAMQEDEIPVVEETVVEIPEVEEPVTEEVVEVPAVETPEETAPQEQVPEVEVTEINTFSINDETIDDESIFKYVVDDREAAYLESVKTKHADVIAQIRQNMVKVEGGSFVMGVEEQTVDFDSEMNEGPAHKVNLDSYCIGRYPVTQKQWTAIMGYNHSAQLNDEFPIAPVDWNECMLFVSRLNELTGLKFSLPTEAQWEFAARGGNRSKGYIYAGSNTRLYPILSILQ